MKGRAKPDVGAKGSPNRAAVSIALELAILRGNDPDHPRSLSKVTRTT